MLSLARKQERPAEPRAPRFDKTDEMIAVCQRICEGDFEARILDIPTEPGRERELALKINEMIDRIDAYVRESTACLHYVEKNRYFRRIVETGMRGNFLIASRAINQAADWPMPSALFWQMPSLSFMVSTSSPNTPIFWATPSAAWLMARLAIRKLPRMPVSTMRRK